MVMALRSPYPYQGGKSRVASLIWQRFGDVPNYVEPCFGSGAVLLSRPHKPGTETVKDANAFICNVWRAIQSDPETVARYCDAPPNECDLHAIHLWLVTDGAAHVERLRTDPDYYDAKIAGRWLYGACLWIGTGWCATLKPSQKLPHMGNAGRGVHRPSQKLPHMGDAGMGVHRASEHDVYGYMRLLSERLRNVRVACGDWSRVCGDSVTWRHGMTGVLLDPPYAGTESVYSESCVGVAVGVREWCAANDDNPLLRIALCSYGDQPALPGWERVLWHAQGGYGLQGDGEGRKNRKRETIDFSPACLKPGLFTAEDFAP